MTGAEGQIELVRPEPENRTGESVAERINHQSHSARVDLLLLTNGGRVTLTLLAWKMSLEMRMAAAGEITEGVGVGQ